MFILFTVKRCKQRGMDPGLPITPELSNLRWMKDGQEISEALVDDGVTLAFDVQHINNGKKVWISIYEHDDNGEHDHVCDVCGVVENGQVAAAWDVVYTEDEDDSESGEEKSEKGYTLPEYFFVAKYGDVQSEESPVLEVKGWYETVLRDKDTKKILGNTKYILVLPGGQIEKGISDETGRAYGKGLPFCEKYLIIDDGDADE
jgi:hypothetical protein